MIQKSRFAFLVALFFATGVLHPSARAVTETESVAAEIEKLIPAICAIKDKEARDGTLRVIALSLARIGNFETALQINNRIPDAAFKQKNRDEIWRITARRLAWQGNIAAATRSANRIQGKYSRTDAQLAVARAYLRQSDSAATRRILNRALPTIRAAQSPRAASYLAYLFAQAGDAKTARELFTKATSFPYSGEMERNESYDERRAIVAYFQAKCGWSKEALATTRAELSTLRPAKPLLIARREWTLLREFADKLPTLQAIDFLLELSGAQLQAKDSAAARDSLEAAKAYFASLPREWQNSKAAPPTQLRLALFEIANGGETQGHARFAEIAQSPHLSANWEFAFYYLLIEPHNQKVLNSSAEQRISYEQKAIAALARIRDTPYLIQPFDLLDIARAQKARGDLSAVRQTLRLAKVRIREELVSPHGEDSRAFRSVRASNSLLNLARSERDAGFDYRTTLAQAEYFAKLAPSEFSFAHTPYDFARKLFRYEFFDEAVEFLKHTELQNATFESVGLLPSGAGHHARVKGVKAAMRWVRRMNDPQLRAMALTAMAVFLTPRLPEESELILSGSNNTDLKVQSWPVSNDKPLFDLTPFLIRE